MIYNCDYCGKVMSGMSWVDPSEKRYCKKCRKNYQRGLIPKGKKRII